DHRRAQPVRVMVQRAERGTLGTDEAVVVMPSTMTQPGDISGSIGRPERSSGHHSAVTRGAEHAENATDSPLLWAARAATAEQAVVARHVRRLWAIPRTQLGVSGWPASLTGRLHQHWNYWWQAHLLDCVVDA